MVTSLAKLWLSLTPLYIFDLDGTLALIDHRRPVLENLADKQRWNKFHELCWLDEPNYNVIKVLEDLKTTGSDIWIFSGRSDSVRALTVEWLCRHTSLTAQELETSLVMRPSHDHRPDDELKQKFLNKMLLEDRARLVCIFDDRQRVVDMWRRNGITCLQVAPGEF